MQQDTKTSFVEHSLTTDCGPENQQIGIPHVPSMIWQAEQERSRQMVLEGKCPLHHDLIEHNELSYSEDGECPYCERGE